MAGQTVSDVVATQLETVVDKLPVLFERETKFYTKIEKRNVESMSTRDMRVPMEIRTGGDFAGFDADGGDLGRGSAPDFDKATLAPVDMRFAVEWTARSSWGTDTSRKAVVNTFKRLVAKSMEEMRRQLDSQCMTDGTGVLGTISAISTTAGVDTITLGTDGFGAKLLRSKQRYNVYDTTLATNRTGAGQERTITYYDLAGKQIKGAAVTGAIVGDKLVVAGVSATPPAWLFGVPYHHNSASTGTWQGYTRSATPEIRANRVNASSTPLALPFPRRARNLIGDRLGEDAMGKTSAFMHPCQKQAYEELGQLVTVSAGLENSGKLDRYFGDNMQMAGAKVEALFIWDKTRIDFVNFDLWGRAELHPVTFYEDANGNKFFNIRGASGGPSTSQVFYIAASQQIFHMNPAGAAYIDGLTVPTGY